MSSLTPSMPLAATTTKQGPSQIGGTFPRSRPFRKNPSVFIAQYSNFSILSPTNTTLFVKGALTLSENIADTGGLLASCTAWKKHEAVHGLDELLSGFEAYTREQLFFMSHAQFWYAKTGPANAAMRIYQDPHAPAFARILGTVANSRGFREAFRVSCEGICL